LATLIRSVKNETSTTISIRVPGINPSGPVEIAASATLDLLTVVSEDELEALQDLLAGMVSRGSLSTTATIESTNLHKSEGTLAADVAEAVSDASEASSDASSALSASGTNTLRLDSLTG